jgi:AcrR family transcriptional regulator
MQHWNQMTLNLPTHDLRPAQDLRIAEILARARNTFAEKGFDGASMQDLARSAGMSVGNFYRYFPSKAAMVEALITADMLEMQRDFGQILTAPEPMQRLRDMIRYRLQDDGDCAQDGRVWAEITAAAMRKPEIAAITARMENQITANLCAVFAQVSGLTEAVALARFRSHAHFIVMMVKTAAMTSPERCAVHGELMAHVERTIDRTLNDVLDLTKGLADAH